MLMDTTIFAPSNTAFEAIGSAANGLSVEDLSSVLSYHVVHGSEMALFSTNLAMMNMTMAGKMSGMNMRREATMEMTLETLAGGNLTVRVEDGSVFVNSAKVVIADVITQNGVVHIIDK